VTMDLNGVERIHFDALGGADNIVVGDLSGTGVSKVEIDLAGVNGTKGGGDGQADSVNAIATQGNDAIVVDDAGTSVTVSGLPALISIENAEAQNDRLTINGQGGDDVIDARGLDAGHIALTLNGGLGKDLILGSQGDDLINGGDGDDVALMGAGDDVFVWNPGEDNDTLEGQAGTDTMLFNGANIAENIDISANGERVRFFRNVANVTMDLNDVEHIDFNALGGADNIVVGDLSGTDVTQVNLHLAGAGGAGDGSADTVIVNGTSGDDVAVLSLRGGALVVSGLGAEVVIDGFEAANDRLVFNGLAGNDVVDASALPANVMQLVIDGGAGDDVLIGGAGDDVLLGGDGDDVLIGGAGLDVLDGGPGDNIVIQ
jgi:Ca2+-binding RTX toxin-like protein